MVFLCTDPDRNFFTFNKIIIQFSGVCNSILNPVTEAQLLHFVASEAYKKADGELMPPPPKKPRPLY